MVSLIGSKKSLAASSDSKSYNKNLSFCVTSLSLILSWKAALGSLLI